MLKKISLITLAVLATAMAWAAPLEVKLEAFKVVTATDGTETFVPATEAAPGEIIEYRALCTNTTEAALRNVQPVIPVPAGLHAVAGSDKPKATDGSLDGTTFSSLPLKDADGQPVPHASLRALRWTLSEIQPGVTSTVTVRTTVNR